MAIKTKWDLSKLGTGLDDSKFERELRVIKKKYKSFENKWSKNKKYLTSINVLKSALDEYAEISEKYAIGSTFMYYLVLRQSLDSQDTKIRARMNIYNEEVTKIANSAVFFSLDLGKIEKKKQREFLNSPELTEYKKLLSGIFETAKYNLTEKEEKILSLKSGVSSGNWTSMLSEFLSAEEPETVSKNKSGEYINKTVSFNELFGLISNKDKKIRRAAFIALNKILEKHENVAEKEINSFLENKKINDDLRGFSRPDQARHLSDDIESKSVDAMLNAVSENFKIAKDFYKLKLRYLKKNHWSITRETLPMVLIAKNLAIKIRLI